MHRKQMAVATLLLSLAGCGGNPPDVSNTTLTTNQALSFAYFQRCINPIFQAQLQTQLNGTTQINTCAASGCHESVHGAGGALRIVPTAPLMDLTSSKAVLQASDMYKNFYSSQGEVVIASPLLSRLLDKPELHNTLHGGGLIFSDPATDPNVALITYWINHPLPIGQDEFSASANYMFTPADPVSGTCNTQ